MAVQVLAGPVIPHRGARVGVAGGDLYVAQVSASVEHGRDESYLYLILKNAWQRPVLASEGREARTAERSQRRRDAWSWSS
jgi:hypothetical protein